MRRTQQKPDTAIQNRMIGLRNDLLKYRELQLMEQLKANAEIRRRAMQANQTQNGARNSG